MKINVKAIEKKAKDLKRRLGGRIFVFPVDEHDAFSEYAFTTYFHGMFHTYPESAPIGEAAHYIHIMLDLLKKYGITPEYDRDVRFVSYEKQMNAPSVTMRRLRKDQSNYKTM